MPLVLYYDSLGHNIMVGTGTWDVYWTGYNAGLPPNFGHSILYGCDGKI